MRNDLTQAVAAAEAALNGTFPSGPGMLTMVPAATLHALVLAAKAPVVSDADRTIITDLTDLVSRVNTALDDSEEMEGDDGERVHVIQGQDFDDVCEALHRLEELPDDKPGETLCPGGRAEWALRTILNSACMINHPLERDRFEAWARITGTWDVQREDDPELGTTGYADFHMSIAWMGWMAHAASAPAAKPVSYRWRRNARSKWQYEDWIAISDEEVREMRADGYEVQELACNSPVGDAEQPAEVAAIAVEVPFDEHINELGWKLLQFLASNGLMISRQVHNDLKPFLRECIAEWLTAHPTHAGPAAAPTAITWPDGWVAVRDSDAWTVVSPDGQKRVWHEKTTAHDDSVFMWSFMEALVAKQSARWAQARGETV